LLLGATVVLQSASLRETVAAFAPVYPWLVFGAGILLGWRFKRSQLVVALVVLFAAERTIMVFPPAGPSGTTDPHRFRRRRTEDKLDSQAIVQRRSAPQRSGKRGEIKRGNPVRNRRVPARDPKEDTGEKHTVTLRKSIGPILICNGAADAIFLRSSPVHASVHPFKSSS
jgi:hypothetical protein